MDDPLLLMVVAEIFLIQKQGHGEVTVKIKNGAIYRILSTKDKLVTPACDPKVDKA